MDMFDFLIRFNLIVILLIFTYDVLLASSVFHQFKRVFLLTVPIMGAAVGYVGGITWNQVTVLSIELPLQELTRASLPAAEATWSWMSILLVVWLLGALIQSIRFVLSLIQIKRCLSNDSTSGSFTFLQRIHIDPALTGDARQKILLHEQVHADQWHSLDLIYYSLLSIIFWFNPFFAMGHLALKDVHEYIADEYSNKRSDNYSNTLLASAFGISQMPMANEFKSINIKNRLHMLNKKRTRAQRKRILTALGVVLVIATTVACTTIQEEKPLQKVYDKVDQMPRFAGCEEDGLEEAALDKCALHKMYAYIGTSVSYPKDAEKGDVEGNVVVGFVIDVSGKVTQARIVKSVDSSLDAEALRAVEAMPNWVPGVHEGKNVSVSLELPVMFKLAD